MKKTVYIASAYTQGDTAINVKAQLDIANQLMDFGFAPYTPLLSHFQHMAHPRKYQDWIELDNVWVLKCDMVLRLKGISPGADKKCELAKKHGITVYYNIAELIYTESERAM